MYKVAVIFIAAVITFVVTYVAVACRKILKTECDIRRQNKDEFELYAGRRSSSLADENIGNPPESNFLKNFFMSDPDEEDCFGDDLKIHSQKYYALSQEVKDYYDEVVLCSLSVKGSQRYFCDDYEEYCLRGTRLVRFVIHKGAVICELVIPSAKEKTDGQNKYFTRQNSFKINLADDTSVAAVKAVIRVIAAMTNDCPAEQGNKVCDNCVKNNKR